MFWSQVSVKTMIPQTTPNQNEFSLILFDRNNEVKDAAMGVPGRQILSGLNVQAG